jgi:hypothetical protein
LNRASPKHFCPWNASARKRRVGTLRRPTATPPYTHAEAGLGPLVRMSWDPLAPHRFLPHSPCATRRVRHGQAEPTVPPPAQRRRLRTPRTHAAMSCPCRERVDDLALREPPCSAAYNRARTPLARDHQSAAVGTMVAVNVELPVGGYPKNSDNYPNTSMSSQHVQVQSQGAGRL